ncbi:hypothetical protein GCM10009123_07310 [Kangiella japonica]|uniref:Uncharacterized protein n=1 Tax=Kangiella japonica TaxID=647384 RepID=A0ABP3CH24_9GAMM
MTNEFDQKLWQAQEAAFIDYKSDQQKLGPLNKNTEAYYQLYHLLNEAEAESHQPPEFFMKMVTHKMKRRQKTQKIKAFSSWLIIILLAVMVITTFITAAKKSILLTNITEVAPWFFIAATVAAIAITATGINRLLTSFRHNTIQNN